jgi:hypothetical protein
MNLGKATAFLNHVEEQRQSQQSTKRSNQQPESERKQASNQRKHILVEDEEIKGRPESDLHNRMPTISSHYSTLNADGEPPRML